MIVDASLVIDAVADPGPQGLAARTAVADVPATDALRAPGHFPIEVTSGLAAAANRPEHPLRPADLEQAVADVASYEVEVTGTPWSDVRRAWRLSQGSLRYADAVYVAAAEREKTTLLTADRRIERSGAKIFCTIITV